MKKVGIIGYGSVGQFLVDKILNDGGVAAELELAFVWNRSADKLNDERLPEHFRMTGDLEEGFRAYIAGHNDEDGPAVDMIVEVAHPDIVGRLGPLFLRHCDLYVSSLTSLADHDTESRLRHASDAGNGLYIPTGAGWGVADILKMDQLGTLRGLEVSMQFNADALKLNEPLKTTLSNYLASPEEKEALVLHDGNIRDLAHLAPNNVNTMICLALAGRSVGFEGARGVLIAQKEDDAHIVEIAVEGPGGFKVKTTRYNPAKKGAVTGSQTYGSFLASLLKAGGQQSGIHFC